MKEGNIASIPFLLAGRMYLVIRPWTAKFCPSLNSGERRTNSYMISCGFGFFKFVLSLLLLLFSSTAGHIYKLRTLKNYQFTYYSDKHRMMTEKWKYSRECCAVVPSLEHLEQISQNLYSFWFLCVWCTITSAKWRKYTELQDSSKCNVLGIYYKYDRKQFSFKTINKG